MTAVDPLDGRSRRHDALSRRDARRIALAAQGFRDPRPTGRVDRRHLARVLARTGLLQLDSVNVLVRAHYLPVFSRLGAYPRDALDRWTVKDRALFEYWGHAASLLPVATQPYLRWRMDRALTRFDTWGAPARLARERPGYVAAVLSEVRDRGPMTAAEVETALEADRPRRSGPWWDWRDTKIALEWLFWTGEVTTASRRGFERVYDVPERVLPAAVLAAPTPAVEEAFRECVRIAARALGVATAADLRDYLRLPAAPAREAVADLVAAGELRPVTVQGWRTGAYLWHDAPSPRPVRARAVLAPFDPLVWERDRAERLFGMRYRVEIYVPAPQRVHGYYVLPFLLGEHLVARVDLKSDRPAGVLRVQSAFAEPGAPAHTATELAAALAELGGWLGLGGVVSTGRGDLALPLPPA